MNPRKAACFLAVLLFACVPLALAQGTYTQIDVPGATFTYCSGIDTAGDIVGYYSDVSGTHGFLLSGGTYTTIDYPGSQMSYLSEINDLGQIVGGTDSAGFLYDVQTQTFSDPISYPGASYTAATAINNAGTIAGYFAVIESGHQKEYGFELVDTIYSKIAPPRSGNSTQVFGITTSGELIGNAHAGGLNFRFNEGQYRRITIPNTPTAQVLGIAPGGKALVGMFSPPSGGKAGFLYRNNILRTLEFPGAFNTFAWSTNNAFTVVGSFDEISGTHGFTWTPPADASKK